MQQSWNELRRWARSSRPVFIVGEPRSGTSILFRSLQAHPAFVPEMGTHLAESHAADLLLDLFTPADVVADGLLAEYAHSADAVAAVAADVAALERRRRLVRSVAGRERLARLPLWLAAGEQHVLRRYFREAHERRGAQRPLDKSALHVRWMPHLGVAFPNARFLYILRHPIDVFTSYRRRYIVDPEASAWANIDEDEFCTGWKERVRLATRRASRDSRLLIVRYEEFTADTTSVLKRVLDHVGEPFDARCLVEDKPEETWRTDPHLFGEVVQSTKVWQDYVDVDVARRIEQELAPYMAQLGYVAYVR